MKFALRILTAMIMTAGIMPAGTANAVCSSPGGVEGEIVYNETSNVPQYCDNTNWIAMTGGDPDTCPNGQTSCGGAPNERVAFITENTQNPRNFGGISGADATCQSEADAAGVNGRYLAWLSDDTTDPATRFEQSTLPYVLTTGVKVADDWSDLTDGTIDFNIDRYANGSLLSTFNSAATNTNADGTVFSTSDHCSNYTANTGSVARGTPNQTSSNWSYNPSSTSSCDNGTRIYCFEQPTAITETVPSGLVGHWRLDETSGTTAFDSSGNGNDGALKANDFSSLSTTGVINAAYVNDGTTNCVQFSTTAGGAFDPDTISISAWFKLSDLSRSQRIFFRDGQSYTILTNPSANTLTFRVTNDSLTTASANLSSFNAIEDKWSHVVGTYDGSNIKLYLNGELKVTTPQTGLINDGASFASIGANGTNCNGTVIDGSIDDLRLYDRAITADEIAQIYAARDGIRYNKSHRTPEFFDGNKFVSIRPPFPEVDNGLTGHWKLDETSGTTATDSSVNGNDGSVMNTYTIDTPGAVDRSMSLISDGTIQVTSTTGITNLEQASFSMWFKVDIDGDKTQHLLAKNGDYTLQVNTAQNNFNFNWYLWTTNGKWKSANNSIPTYDQWHHVVVTYDASNVSNAPSFYLNGTLLSSSVSTTPIAPAVANISTRLNIGNQNNSANPIDGRIDDVRIYNRILSTAEITQLYTMGTPIGASSALPLDCPNIGDVCDDGTYYVGLSLDGNVEMFVAPEDAPGGNIYQWNNNNTSGYVTTNLTDSNDGDGSTATLVITDSDSVTTGFQTHIAAQYCYDLNTNGANDWYLPAESELQGIFDSGFHDTFGMLTGSAGDLTTSYWSSRETSTSQASRRNSSGVGSSGKSSNLNIRCVRKGPAPRCTNPYGIEGQMIYNSTHDIVQYCDGAHWIGVGKDG